MAKRPSLKAEIAPRSDRRAAAHQASAALEPATPAVGADDEDRKRNNRTADNKPLTTTITTDWETLELLRLVAHRRAIANRGGRPSVSALVQELIDRHREELEREAYGPR
jgi:hypothetical protein